jgi:adenylate cyclase
MASLIPGFEYDIFISYRQKDNKGDKWVSEFVEALKDELESTFKEEISVYFDINPHDGLLETHDVDASLKEKLKSLILIPIISQTYCDDKCFAWKYEFVVFNQTVKEDQFGRDIRLTSGNVASRILPVKIHDLDAEDKILLENEMGGALRSIDFIYTSAGVNRPLRSNEDHPSDNLNKTYYRDQINKVANAVKEIIIALKKYDQQDEVISSDGEKAKIVYLNNHKINIILASCLILALIIMGYFILSKRFRNDKPTDKTIAVLPFRNISNDSTQLYFCYEFMEELLNDLQRIKSFTVRSRTSSDQYRNTKKSITIIGNELNVNYLVEGSVSHEGNNIKIWVQLIDAKDDKHLWSDEYLREMTIKQIFSLQSEIASAIASELEAVITPQEKRLIESVPTDNLEAYRLYMVGNFFMSQWGEVNFRKAIDNYKQAIALDSSFAEAYANLASAYFELTWWDVPVPYPEFIPLAKTCALKALEINKNLGEAYFVIGSIKYIHEQDFSGAEQDFKKGMELSPNFVWGRISYANLLSIMGRFKESISIGRQTLELNPLDPGTYIELGFALALDGQDKEALKLYNKSLELKPDSYNAIACLMSYYSERGIFNHFLSDQIDSLTGSSTNNISKASTFNLFRAGQYLAKVGHRAEALNILNELNRRAAEGTHLSSIDMGILYSALGEDEKAIDLLEKGFNEKESWILVNIECTSASIRSNIRFQELLKKMGFENE